jgi:hypothetical protein
VGCGQDRPDEARDGRRHQNPSFRSAGHLAGAYLLRVQRPIQRRLAQLIIGQDAVVLPPFP